MLRVHGTQPQPEVREAALNKKDQREPREYRPVRHCLRILSRNTGSYDKVEHCNAEGTEALELICERIEEHPRPGQHKVQDLGLVN